MSRSLLLGLLLGAAPAVAQPADAPLDTLRTRAEASAYRATSTYADVVAFVGALAADSALHLTTFGTTAEGRALPLVVWGAPDATPEAVRATGKLRALLLANIHAGEVAGKEAVLELLRDIAAGRHAAWSDALVLLVVPVYNADGNERVDPSNRPLQHGPVEGMGERHNAQGIDLNRDFVKLEAPESRALVAALDAYDPHVFIDLHTTNGTAHGYHLTYAPPLHPNTHAGLDALLRARWLPELTQGFKARTGWDAYYYGNLKPEWGLPDGWATFDPRPRFSTNYVGLRNRFGLLSEAYSYATFDERIAASKAFVVEALNWAYAHAAEVRAAIAEAESHAVVGQSLALRSAWTWEASEAPVTILMGEVEEEANPLTDEPMWRRLDVQRPVEVVEYGRFGGREAERVPAAYLVPPALTDVAERLAAHGVRLERVDTPASVPVEAFRVDSVRVADEPYEGRHLVEPFGAYQRATVTVEPGTLVVPVDGPNRALSRLIFSLLEPRSDGGFTVWGYIPTAAGDTFPVRRVVTDEDAARLRAGPGPGSPR